MAAVVVSIDEIIAIACFNRNGIVGGRQYFGINNARRNEIYSSPANARSMYRRLEHNRLKSLPMAMTLAFRDRPRNPSRNAHRPAFYCRR